MNLTVQQAATALGITEGGLRLAIHRKTIAVIRHGTGHRCVIEIEPAEVERYARETSGRGRKKSQPHDKRPLGTYKAETRA